MNKFFIVNSTISSPMLENTFHTYNVHTDMD